MCLFLPILSFAIGLGIPGMWSMFSPSGLSGATVEEGGGEDLRKGTLFICLLV